MQRHVLASLSLLTAVAGIGGAQAPGSAGATPSGSISGVVRDSLARGPLAGAWVQFVEAGRQATVARTVITDSLGRFAFDGVPNGRYTIGFFHTLLDSLGVEPLLRQVTVSRGRAARVELATPSPARLRAVICGAPVTRATGGVVLGVVRDAQTRQPVAGATVTGEWLEVSIRPGAIDRQRSRVDATTESNGWFALCNVPARGMMFLQASRGGDSTDVLDLPIPASGFVHRQLYVGSSRTIAFAAAAAAETDTLLPVRRTRVGEGLLAGTIVTASGGRPVAGALVRLGDNPPTRADDRGGFVLAEAPAGTRMLEVRAVGYNPARMAVDVIPGAPPANVALATSKAVLDTVKVTVARAADRHASGFEDRRRSGAGMYLTAEQIARRGAFATSDLFRVMRGMRIGYDYDTLETDGNPDALSEMNQLSDKRILMRGISGNWCEPALWFDGILIPELSAYALDGWVPPDRLAAIEIYSEATVPPQFQRTRSACGAVLFWTK